MLSRFLLFFFTLLFTFTLILSPQRAFQAAWRGLELWGTVVTPALFPFFVLAEFLQASGIIRFFGIFLEPVMRPLFNLPGSSAFVLALGFTSGAPTSALLTARLREQKLCTRAEAEKLLGFTSNASPLFLLGAVAVGMFKDPSLGPTLAGAHYLANLCQGFFLGRFFAPKEETSLFPKSKENLWRQAWATLFSFKTPPLGALLSEAIRSALRTILTVGGFIVVFSVLLEALTFLGLLSLPSLLLVKIGFDPTFAQALTASFFEMTLGVKFISEAPVAVSQRVVAASFVLGWAGLSVHAQVASVISRTDIRLFPFILARVRQSILAAFFTFLFYHPVAPVTSPFPLPSSYHFLSLLGKSLLLFTSILCLGFLMGIILKVKILGFRVRLHPFKGKPG